MPARLETAPQPKGRIVLTPPPEDLVYDPAKPLFHDAGLLTLINELGCTLPDCGTVDEKAYVHTENDHTMNSILTTLSQYLPDTTSLAGAKKAGVLMRYYDSVNSALSDRLIGAKIDVAEALDAAGTTMDEIEIAMGKGDVIDPTIIDPIARVQRIAWELTIVNYRAIYKDLSHSTEWKTRTDQEQYDVFRDMLLYTQKSIAKRYDPCKGKVVTFIMNMHFGDRANQMFFELEGGLPADYLYVSSFRHAVHLIDTGQFGSGSFENLELLTSFFYNFRHQRFTFTDPQKAFAEYAAHANNAELSQQGWEHISWKDPYVDFFDTVGLQKKRIAQVIYDMDVEELDREHIVHIDDDQHHEEGPVPMQNDLIDPEHENPEDIVISDQMQLDIDALVNTSQLKALEWNIIDLVYREGKTYEEAGRTLHLRLSKEQLRRIADKGLRKIRTHARGTSDRTMEYRESSPFS
jgi:hypothetical protein